MTTYPENKILPVTRVVLQCLRDEALQNPKPPAIVGFRTGTSGQVLAGLGADECCDGAAFVRLLRVYPSFGVPATSNLPFRCGQPKAMEVELSMWRCAPIGDIDEPPNQDDWDCLHEDLVNDQLTLLSAACCFIRTREQDASGSTVLGEWNPTPIEGGCVGSTMTMLIDLFGGPA